MTAEVALSRSAAGSAPGQTSGRALATLGFREARRITLSPVYGAVVLIVLAVNGIGTVLAGPSLPSASAAYEGILYVVLLYGGLLTYLAAHLVSTSSRRTHADRQLAASALTTRARGGALCLGVVLGPGLVAAVAMCVLAVLGATANLGADIGTLGGDSGLEAFGVAELVQVALTVVGAGLFGVMVATWVRLPGSMLVGFVALIFLTIFLIDSDHGTDSPLQWLAPYVSTPSFIEEPWTLMGSQAWHAVYLVGLCAMAVCGVMLRRREGRGRWVLISAGVVGLTGVVGWVQL